MYLFTFMWLCIYIYKEWICEFYFAVYQSRFNIAFMRISPNFTWLLLSNEPPHLSFFFVFFFMCVYAPSQWLLLSCFLLYYQIHCLLFHEVAKVNLHWIHCLSCCVQRLLISFINWALSSIFYFFFPSVYFASLHIDERGKKVLLRHQTWHTFACNILYYEYRNMKYARKKIRRGW